MRQMRYVGACIVIVSVCAFLYLVLYRPGADFVSLLSGDTSISITSIEIERRGGHILLSDGQSMSYITRRFQQSIPHQAELGPTYYMTVTLSSGRSVGCALYVPERTNNITIAFPINTIGDPTYYHIPLQEPLPPALADVLSKLSS